MAVLSTLSNLPAIRAYLLRALPKWRSLRGASRYIIAVLALLSFKNLPWIWHLRFVYALFSQLFLQTKPIPPGSLFSPVITSSRTSLWETDFNLHKSNSTYFSDLDISRTHFMAALLRSGILASRNPRVDPSLQNGGPKASMALGGVSCHFRREIKPFAKYEIWTRVLSWDRKWIYLISHIVKPDAGRPSEYALQPWRRAKKAKAETEEERKERLKGAVYATSVSRYVAKKGRVTIPAETVLEHSRLLPPKPKELLEAAAVVGGSVDTDTVSDNPADAANPSAGAKEEMDESFVLAGDISDFTWEKVEEQRLKGLRYAEMFGQLEELHDEWDGGIDGALGVYFDL